MSMQVIKPYVAFAFLALFAVLPCRADSPAVIAQDRYLVKYANGMVYDYQTGLEWIAGPDRATSWEQAKVWVAELNEDGTHWRIPTEKELDTLYHVGDGISNITPLLRNSGYWVWAQDSEHRSAKWVFSFSYGGEGWSGKAPQDGGRAMAVRPGMAR